MSNMLGRAYRVGTMCRYHCCSQESPWHNSKKKGLSRLRQREKHLWRKDQGCS